MVLRARDGTVGSVVNLLPIPERGATGAPMPIGLVAALPWEVRPLLRGRNGIERDGPFYSFVIRDEPALLTIAGMGAENSYRAAQSMLQRFAPRGLVTLGFAGGLQDDLAPGDLVLADHVLEQVTGEQFDCQVDLWPLEGVRRGRLLSVTRMIPSTAEKRRLAGEWGAVAADMESAGVARAAAQAGVPFCAMKAITDSSAQSISIDIARCQSEDKGLFLRKIVGEAIRTPHGIRDLWMLARGARVAARTLAAALCSAESRGKR